MGEERVENPTTSHDRLPPQINKTIVTHRLARNIEAAHENGALFFLATHLEPLLEEFCEKNGRSTTLELETLIVRAAKVMLGE
jgi:hypothetical protein